MATLTLSGFGDEIDPEPAEQIACLHRNGLRFLELRGAWGTNVLDLSQAQVGRLEALLQEAGIGVSAIGSPIGKVDIGSDLEAHFARFRVALERARRFACGYVRVFSFYHDGVAPAACRGAVVAELARMARAAAQEGVVLLHENEKGIYGETPERCLDLLRAVDHPCLRATFDPANFVQAGVDPAVEAWPALAEYVAYFHVKDALRSGGRVVPAGCGDGGLDVILRQAVARGFEGFLSLEPHLHADDPRYGGSGAQRFTTAVRHLRQVLERLGVAESGPVA